MSDQSRKIEKLINSNNLEWIENYQQLPKLTETQLSRLLQQIKVFRLKKALAGREFITSLTFIQMVKEQTAVDELGNQFDLYHLEFSYTTNSQNTPQQQIFMVW